MRIVLLVSQAIERAKELVRLRRTILTELTVKDDGETRASFTVGMRGMSTKELGQGTTIIDVDSTID